MKILTLLITGWNTVRYYTETKVFSLFFCGWSGGVCVCKTLVPYPSNTWPHFTIWAFQHLEILTIFFKCYFTVWNRKILSYCHLSTENPKRVKRNTHIIFYTKFWVLETSNSNISFCLLVLFQSSLFLCCPWILKNKFQVSFCPCFW